MKYTRENITIGLEISIGDDNGGFFIREIENDKIAFNEEGFAWSIQQLLDYLNTGHWSVKFGLKNYYYEEIY